MAAVTVLHRLYKHKGNKNANNFITSTNINHAHTFIGIVQYNIEYFPIIYSLLSLFNIILYSQPFSTTNIPYDFKVNFVLVLRLFKHHICISTNKWLLCIASLLLLFTITIINHTVEIGHVSSPSQ